MKKTKIVFILASVLTISFGTNAYASIDDFLEKKDVSEKIRDGISSADINFGTDLGKLDVGGAHVGISYAYQVESSYQDQYFTRVDSWKLNTGINVGDLVENFVDIPFSFSVDRNTSFVFARQFKDKKSAILALPYTPKRLPLSAESALKNLEVGDFVSMPANLNIAVEAKASTATVAPVVIAATANVYYVISGEFIIQVYKLDETHVRLKLISTRGYHSGTEGGAEISFKLFGIKIIDNQIDRVLYRDLLKLGYEINPGAQFIVDYVFDLKNEEAKEAYNQILKTTFKFKDVVVLQKFQDAKELKDKLISSYAKAEKIFEEDKLKEPKLRRISRMFKGFNNYEGHTKRLKMALVFASFKKENAYTENKITFVDKNENNLEFFYPTFTRYMETLIGKWLFDVKDQSFQTNFGLIPRLNLEDTKAKNPDYGLTFERRDKSFTSMEQRYIQKFLLDQVPQAVGLSKDSKLAQWVKSLTRTDTRIFMQLILKSQGFEYLQGYSLSEIQQRLIEYTNEKQKLHVLDPSNAWEKLSNFLFVKPHLKNEALMELGEKIYNVLKNEENNSEIMTTKLVKLNEHGIFNKIGVGFLISLLPQDKLLDLVYFKFEMTTLALEPVSIEYGTPNYRALYNELTEVQSRISNRSFDLRVTDEDHQLEEIDHNQSAEEILVLK